MFFEFDDACPEVQSINEIFNFLDSNTGILTDRSASFVRSTHSLG